MTQVQRFSIRVPVSAGVRRQLRVIAAHKDMTVSDLFREAMQEYAKAHDIELDMTEGLDSWGGKRQEKEG